MADVNTEEIMKEIKKRVAERGYSDDLLSFDDVEVGEFNADSDERELNSKYKEEYLRGFVNAARKYSRLDPVVNYGNNFKYFVKRVLRKLKSILTFRKRQERFDLNVAKALNQIEKYILLDDKSSANTGKKPKIDAIENIDRTIGELQNKIANLELEIQQLKEAKDEK